MMDHNSHLETDVKQAERVPGMMLVLSGSTLLAVALMAAAAAWASS